MKKNYVLIPYNEMTKDAELTAIEFILKYANLLNGITVEFNNDDMSNTKDNKCYYRSNYSHWGNKKNSPSQYIGTISEDEIQSILSRRQFEDEYLTGREYRFYINPIFIKR